MGNAVSAASNQHSQPEPLAVLHEPRGTQAGRTRQRISSELSVCPTRVHFSLPRHTLCADPGVLDSVLIPLDSRYDSGSDEGSEVEAGRVFKSLSRCTWWTSMDEVTFSRLFDNREGPYHLYDSQNRPLIRAETGERVLAALLDDQDQLVFLDDPGCLESSVLKKTFWAREWLSDPVLPKLCSCGDGRCKGRLVITLHDSYAGPNWKLTFRG